MKRILFVVLALIFATLFIPLIIVSLLSGTNAPPSDTVSVYIKSEDKVEEMAINDYLKCVVAAEMPVDFNEEALKAQAVAARTYLVSHMQGEPSEEHKGADVCSDYAHCQAYISEEERTASWGDAAKANWEKINGAVEATDGLIIKYDNKPISAVFHSTSSGKTERAADVWGEDIPYLQSVDSQGDERSPKYTSEVRLSIDEFKRIASENIEGVNWDNGLYSNIERSDAGGIITLDIGGQNIKGTKFRSMFDLNSTNAEINEGGGAVTMSVRGYGHGVGMSQYGANYLAGEGMGFEDILKSYYTGVKIGKW